MPDSGGPMPGQEKRSVEVTLEGSHLRIDARPAGLVAQLRGTGPHPILVAQLVDGPTHTEAVPEGARRVTYQARDDLTVEVTTAADFVALCSDDRRRLVVAFTGEVTVLPGGGEGDRFALGAHDALLVPAEGGDPRVVPVNSLSEADQAEVAAVVESAVTAVVSPALASAPETAPGEPQAPPPTPPVPGPTPEPTKPATPSTPEPAKPATPSTPEPAKPATPSAPEPVTPSTPEPAKPATPAPPATPATPATKPTGAGSTPAKKGAPVPAKASGGGKRGKKGKKGRPPPPPTKKPAPLVPAAAAGGVAKAPAPPTKKATAPAKKAATGGPGKGARPPKGGGGGGGGGGDSYEDTPSDRRLMVGMVAGGFLVALVLAIFLLTRDTETPVATTAPTTTARSASTTEGSQTTTSPQTTSAPTTTRPATTAAPTTAAPTTAAPTTAATAPAPSYSIEPKSCVQNGNSVTYTAAITNKASVPFDYTIGIVFKDARGATIATANASVTRLAANRTVDFNATATATGTATSCDVGNVDARASR